MQQSEQQKEIGLDITFYEGDDSITINGFDDYSEMSFVIRDSRRNSKAVYTMTVWEVKELKKFLTNHLKKLKQ